jgi:hypothetical protein
MEFADEAAVRAAITSPEYQAVVPHRGKAFERFNLILAAAPSEPDDQHRSPPEDVRVEVTRTPRRSYSSPTWTITSVGATLTRLDSIGTLLWSSLMPYTLASRGRAHK